MENKKENNISCPFTQAMELMSGKWTMSIINTLMSGTHRFKALERAIPGINTRMLVKELKTLSDKGIIDRKAFATMPPTVEYSLTSKGTELKPVIQAIQNWTIHANPIHPDSKH